MATEAEQPVLIKRLLAQTMVLFMRNDFATAQSLERYVVEVDGQVKAEYEIFVKALKAGMQLRQEFPNSDVKLRDVGDETAH
jgi:hypothetical protein